MRSSVLWRQNPSDTTLHRRTNRPTLAGKITFPLEAPPLRYWVALAHGGQIIDDVSGSPRDLETDNVARLSPTVLPEAFEFLDLAWRLLYDRHPSSTTLHRPTLPTSRSLLPRGTPSPCGSATSRPF